jgi:raffinose/stachyose/melibiose transport system substrate-binding protein
MRKPGIVLFSLACGAALVGTGLLGSATGQKSKLVIESWRNDDLKTWQTQIIPAFNKAYPDIEVVFAPSAPTEYNAALDAKLQGGTGGDLITCRPFDKSLELYQKGYLADLSGIKGMGNFSNVAKSAWQTDDGKASFCVPMASVIHGFIYNKKIFSELKLAVPKTEADFYKVLNAVKKNGKYAPLVMGTKDTWESATMGFQNIGPNYWAGEDGRQGLLKGTAQYNKGGFLKAFQALAKWTPFLPAGYQSIAYPDAQNLFSLGKGAIYPAGSWDIGTFNAAKGLEFGAFKPPVPAGSKKCYISDHTDIAIGMNAKSANKEAATKFLEWTTSEEFANIYSNAAPGFFSLNGKAKIKLTDPVAQEFLSWRDDCESTIRSSYQILSRGTPNNETELWANSAAVLNGSKTPVAAANDVQKGLASWYKPAK